MSVSKLENQEKVNGSAPYSQYSESALTSGMMINPQPPAAREDMPPVGTPSLETGHDSDIQKLKDNRPRRHSASPQRRTMLKTGSHENSAEHSPLHPHHQARFAKKVGGSPSSERKSFLEAGHGIAPNTPGRSRLRVSGSPEDGPAVPKFEFDENDPTAGEGFTGIFDEISKEKQTGTSRAPMIIDDSLYINRYHHDDGSNKSGKFCCFNWGKK